jgi:hypothetical protein
MVNIRTSIALPSVIAIVCAASVGAPHATAAPQRTLGAERQLPLGAKPEPPARFTVISVETFHNLQKVTVAVMQDSVDNRCYLLAVSHYTVDPLQVEPVAIGPVVPCEK